ncbi:MAG: gamma-glutamyltranspeptidase/glutathione hydrolase [Granulosicoccus sp.]|jgi:gamma-glutamyltranspeptidase/glutathione hydrolase
MKETPAPRGTYTSTRAFRNRPTDNTTSNARVYGYRGGVATHHHQSALAAHNVLQAGGNAVDAGVAAVLVEGVVNPHMHGPAGECPILIAGPGVQPIAINGNTRAPALATVDALRARGHSTMPDAGILAAGVPASLSALLAALERFGSMPFHRLLEPALELARGGFAMHDGLLLQEKVGVAMLADKFRNDWPSSAAIYLKDGVPIESGGKIVNPQLAAIYDQLAACSVACADYRKGYQAVRREFYEGSVADAIDRYSQANDGLLRAADLATFETPFEQPLSVGLGNTRIFKCGYWCQGPALLQQLQIMKQFDLSAMQHNSAEYLHLLVEAGKLAYADREQYYADPTSVEVPDLLDEEYAKIRSGLVDIQSANADMRPGDPRRGSAELPASQRLGGASWGDGTVHVDVADSNGMIASFTPSGGWIASHEVLPELGIPLGNRGMTFYMEPDNHPNLIAPGKRPRTTISPSLVTRNDVPWIAFGTMGGDQQDQWMLQFYLNVALFDMTLQQAIDAPKCSSEHFNGFFSPHDRFAQRLRIEESVATDVLQELHKRGHELDVAPMWSEGYLNAVSFNTDNGCIEAACDPRGAKGDVFPAAALAW